MQNLITEQLFANQDLEYRTFSQKLIPDTNYPIIGVRVPKIKQIAKNLLNDDALIETFLSSKHKYYEEYFLHGILIAKSNDLNLSISRLEDFLPLIDNWAVCDSTVAAFKIVKKNKAFIFNKITSWLNFKNPYATRFVFVLLLNYYLDDEYIDKVLTLVCKLEYNHYYINMAFAWLISVALVKNYDRTIPLIKSKKLPKFIQNKSIQKAIESFRIDDNKKNYLKKFKIY